MFCQKYSRHALKEEEHFPFFYISMSLLQKNTRLSFFSFDRFVNCFVKTAAKYILVKKSDPLTCLSFCLFSFATLCFIFAFFVRESLLTLEALKIKAKRINVSKSRHYYVKYTAYHICT